MFYHIIKIQDHLKKKDEVLNHMNSWNRHFVDSNISHATKPDQDTFISNTDWGGEEFDWYNFSFSQRDKKSIYDFVGNGDARITKCWFHQYYPHSGSNIGFHNHSGSDLAFIYYLELEDSSLRTIFINPEDYSEVIPDVVEGDLLCFNSNVWHCALPNDTNTRKSFISFNVNF